MKINYGKKEILKKELSAVLEMLDCLSDDENRSFNSFLRSPFFNREETQVALFERLRTAKLKSSVSIRGKDLIRKLYGIEEEEAGIQKLAEGLKGLEQLVQQYIVHTEAENDPRQVQRLLTIGLKKRKNTDLFYRAAAKYEKILQTEPVTIMRLAAEWWLDHQRYFHQYVRESRADIKYFEQSVHKLDQLTQLTKLRYLCESHNRRNVFSAGFSINIAEHLPWEFSQEGSTPEVIWLYERIVPLIRNTYNKASTREFLYHFVNKSGQLASADRVVLAKLLYNVLLRGINVDSSTDTGELMMLLSKYIARHQLYLFEGVISDDEFLNIAIMSGVCGAFKFQAFFIDTFAPFLEAEVRDKAAQFARIYRLFQLEHYTETILELKTLFPPNTQDEYKYVFRAKALTVRSYVACYLLGDYDCYEDYKRAEDNFRHYLTRHEVLNDRYYLSYRNMLSFCNTIVQARNQCQSGPDIVRRLESRLNELQPIIGRPWLEKLIPLLQS